ncbi:exopolysaccharide production repressor protein, partial [Sinorhizobium meliloti]
TTLACLLLFQLAYFGSVLLLVGLAAIAQLSQRLRIFGIYSKTRNHSSK